MLTDKQFQELADYQLTLFYKDHEMADYISFLMQQVVKCDATGTWARLFSEDYLEMMHEREEMV